MNVFPPGSWFNPKYAPTHSFGGRVDPHAIIGHAPESRDWQPGDPCHEPIIDRTARIEAFVSVDAGLWAPTRIGARTWLMKHVHVGHDVVIGERCELSPGVVVGGHAEIGNKVRVGIGAVIRPWVKIGDNARIGMGAVVVRDVPANEIWYGNPATKREWPPNAGPDYGSDPDPRLAEGWSRHLGASMARVSGSQPVFDP